MLSPQNQANHQTVLEILDATLRGGNDPTISAIRQLLDSAHNDMELNYAILGTKIIYQNKLAEIEAILRALPEIQPPPPPDPPGNPEGSESEPSSEPSKDEEDSDEDQKPSEDHELLNLSS